MSEKDRDTECLTCWEELAECKCGNATGYSDKAIYCPYCGHANNTGDFDIDDDDVFTCFRCEKDFIVSVHVFYKWETRRMEE